MDAERPKRTRARASATGAAKPDGPAKPGAPARPERQRYRAKPAADPATAAPAQDVAVPVSPPIAVPGEPVTQPVPELEPEAVAPEPEPIVPEPEPVAIEPVPALEPELEPEAVAPEPEPVVAEPVVAEPDAPQPVLFEPAGTAPSASEPAGIEPAASESAAVPAGAIGPRIAGHLAAARTWVTTPRPPITWAPPEPRDPGSSEVAAAADLTPLTRSIAIRIAAAGAWVTTPRPPITWTPPEPEPEGTDEEEPLASEAVATVAPAVAPVLEPEPAEALAEPLAEAPAVAAVLEPEPAAPVVVEPVAAVTAVGLWDAVVEPEAPPGSAAIAAPSTVESPIAGAAAEATPEAPPLAVEPVAVPASTAVTVPDETAVVLAPTVPDETAVVLAPTVPDETVTAPPGPPAPLTWAGVADANAWTPPVAGIAWPATLASDAWPVVDPGPRATGAWRSAGYRSSARRGTALDRGLFASGTLLGVTGATILAADAFPAAAAIVDVKVLVPFAAAIIAAVLLGTVALGLAWLGRAVDNIPPLTGRTPWMSPRQVVGLCVIPGFHLVIPWMAVEDLVTRVLPPGRASIRGLVRAWAFVLAGAQVIGTVAVTVAAPAPSWLIAAALLAGMLSAMLLFLVVRRVEDRASRVALMLDLGGSAGRRWPAFPEPERVADAPTPAPSPRPRSAGRQRRRRG